MIKSTDQQLTGIKVAAQWIEALEATTSRVAKEKIIEQAVVFAELNAPDAEILLFNLYLAYNPYFIYGVKQVASTHNLTEKPNPWPVFWALCEDLRTRQVTGHAARDRIVQVSKLFDSTEWNQVCKRVLLKDMRCGISEKTINKVVKNTAWAIPVFSTQLATDCAGQVDTLTGTWQVEPKLDGVRALAFVTPNTVTLMSRNGKPFDTFDAIVDSIISVRDKLTEAFGLSFVLDGEILGHSFQQLMRQARRKQSVDTSDMTFNIFDCIPAADFKEGVCETSQRKRTAILQSQKDTIESCANLSVITPVLIDLSTDEGHQSLQKLFTDTIDAGFEGLMIKDVRAAYRTKRTRAWLKLKPNITVDLTVVAVEQGTGRNEHRLGALVCEGTDANRTITVNVGSGFSDDDRTQYWQERNFLLGRIVEIQADAITQNQNGTYSLRFPRFVRFRAFEPGEKM